MQYIAALRLYKRVIEVYLSIDTRAFALEPGST
jgi:hypothetical protein